MRSKKINLLVLLFLSSVVYGQYSEEHLEAISPILSKSIFSSSNLSISVFEVESGKEIFGHNSEKVLTPASSLKLLTSLTGLKYLGEDFKFETILGYKGVIQEDGTLQGDLVVKGGGDPTLGSMTMEGVMEYEDLLDHITNCVIDKGITCITGKVIIDESIYDSYPVAPTWQLNDLGNYYASGAWGLNINENLYKVYFKNRTKVGARPTLNYHYPKIPLLRLSNEIMVDSAGTGDQAYIFGGPYNYNKRIIGTIPAGEGSFAIKGSIPDPPSFFGKVIKQNLAKNNIQSGKVETIYRAKTTKLKPLDTIYSPNLFDIVKKVNFDSNNLYAESILKMLGYKLRGQGSGQNGIASIFKLLKSMGIKTKPLHLHDGSGLSVRNEVSSQSLAKFLAKITRYIDMETMTQIIPRAGHTGTVKGMLKQSKARGKAYIKSGSMEAIQSYTGYVSSLSGKWYSFSIIVNGYSAEYYHIRNQLEKIINQIYLKG